MTIFQLPVFGSIFSTTSRPDRLRKSIGPISAVLKRQQPFATTSNRQTPHKQQGPAPGETVTEGYILNNFPRPNLSPTLHLRLGMFGSTSTWPIPPRTRKQSAQIVLVLTALTFALVKIFFHDDALCYSSLWLSLCALQVPAPSIILHSLCFKLHYTSPFVIFFFSLYIFMSLLLWLV
ncbi:unnamed protein product [Umbelopsis ramanniana]